MTFGQWRSGGRGLFSALDALSSKHLHRRDGRSEARERIDGRRTLLVVYRRTADEIVVINAM
jgi:hypothetical protein